MKQNKAFVSGTRISLSALDVLNLHRSDFVAFSISSKIRTKINLRFTTEKGARREYMFYALSEIVERVPTNFKNVQGCVIFKKATLNIEWLSILSLLEQEDELELLWCLDSSVTENLQNNFMHMDSVRIVIHKKDSHQQYHIRLHTHVGDRDNRLIKVYY